MRNYVVTNAYINTQAFINVKNSLKRAFDNVGEDVVFLTNDKAYSLCKNYGDGQPILFFDKDILLCTLLEKSGYKPINGKNVIEICDDKALTYAQLLNKVPLPKTIILPFTYENIGYTNCSFIDDIEKEISYPLILKEGKGSFGNQVFLINNRNELLERIKQFEGRSLVVQEFIEESRGQDIRVYVVGGKTVACAKRVNETDFRSNVQSGGKMINIDTKDGLYVDYLRLAEKTCDIIGADFAGVDILISNRGGLVCEVNSNAHFHALSQISGVDVAQKIVEHYLSLKK